MRYEVWPAPCLTRTTGLHSAGRGQDIDIIGIARLDLLQLPDIHTELSARGDGEFRLWLRDQPTSILRSLIRKHDLDATRRTVKWREPEKLAEFIADGMSARSTRGSAFIRGRPGE